MNGCVSDWKDVESSVVQGSVLGGILFDIFIDDIDEAATETLLRKFADDTNAAMLIRNQEDSAKFQQVINQLCDWAEAWEMSFNLAKCKILHFGKKNPKFEYHMRGVKLEEATEEKDLGVWITTTLKPSRQCGAAASMAHFNLGQIQRTFHYRKKSHLIPLYRTFVRPKLEFCVGAWSPWTEADISTLEKVQARAIRLVSDKRGTTYGEKLKSVGLCLLKERRERGDAIEAFKTLNGFNRVNKNAWFEISGPEARATRRTTSIAEEGEERRPGSLYRRNFNLEVRKNFYTVRVVPVWNALPDWVRQQKTINGFKNAYDRWKENPANQSPRTAQDS